MSSACENNLWALIWDIVDQVLLAISIIPITDTCIGFVYLETSTA